MKEPITLATLKDATEQEVFDQVAGHLLRQGKRSVGQNKDGEWKCKYRGDNGLQCAAGCLIGDDEYQEEFEHKAWDSLAGIGEVPEWHENLIDQLQHVHDRIDVAHWETNLRSLAVKCNLDYNEEAYK